MTGSTKGIGRAMAQGCAAPGASVVVSSRKQDLCDEVAKEIAADTGAEVLGLACHVGEWDAIPGFVERVHDRFGRIDGLVNNAGINPARVSIVDMTLEFWRKVFSVNLEGPLRMSQCVAPIMRDQGGGSIVNIGTMAAYSGGGKHQRLRARRRPRCSTSRRAWRMEWAPWNVRVNMLSPGPFMSEMMEGGARTAARVPRPRRRRHVHEADRRSARDRRAGLYLISDASSFVTGDDLSVSGGMQK